MGSMEVMAKYQNLCQRLPLLVTDTRGANVFGMDWFQKFGFKVRQEGCQIEQVYSGFVDCKEKVDVLCEKYGDIFK